MPAVPDNGPYPRPFGHGDYPDATQLDGEHTLLRVFGGLRPVIVVLCGSSRFYDEYQQAYYDLTMRGEIVLSIGFYPHAKAAHGHGEGVGHDSAEKVKLDDLHLRKIDLADYVVVVSDETGYFGESTTREIRYALEHAKPVAYLRPSAFQRAMKLGLFNHGLVPRREVP
jgi:hypothetical protein